MFNFNYSQIIVIASLSLLPFNASHHLNKELKSSVIPFTTINDSGSSLSKQQLLTDESVFSNWHSLFLMRLYF